MASKNEAYNALLSTVLNKEPVAFKGIFEELMREKVTQYVAVVKEDLHKEIFNIKEDKTSGESDKGDSETSNGEADGDSKEDDETDNVSNGDAK